MNIAISGASGFVGGYLTEQFKKIGFTVYSLGRKQLKEDAHDELMRIISNSDVVINLAGAPINRRWTKKYKQELYASRIETTQKIVEAINVSPRKPKLLISTSAVGYYSTVGCHDEYHSVEATDFLGLLCKKWEQEAEKVTPEVRLAITRFGVVLAKNGGAFPSMILPTKLGVATIIGNGEQPFSWIDLEDLFRAMFFVIENENMSGVINFVASDQTTNKSFTKDVAKAFRSFLTIKIPYCFFRLVLGEASSFVSEGQCVKSTKLNEAGFVFQTKSIQQFLNANFKSK